MPIAPSESMSHRCIEEMLFSSRFHGYEQDKSEIEIGWTFLARTHWGGTYNKEVKQLMLNHAFKYVNSIVFLIGPQNFRSRRAIEKIGATVVGERQDGGGRISLVYRITTSQGYRNPTKCD